MARRSSQDGGLGRGLRTGGAGLRSDQAAGLAGTALARRRGALVGLGSLAERWQLNGHDLAALNLQGQAPALQELGLAAEHLVAPPLHRRHVGVLLDGNALEVVAVR